MNAATINLGILVYIIFGLIDIAISYVIKHNYLKNYRPITVTTLKICELVFTSYIFVPIVTVFMHPRSNSNIGVCLLAIICCTGLLWCILVRNANTKTYLNDSKLKNEQKIIDLLETQISNEQKVRDMLQDQISEHRKVKAAESNILHKKHI